MKHTVKTYGTYGLLAGLIIFSIHLAFLDYFDYATNELLGYLSIFICLSFIFLGIKHYRDRVNNGLVSLGQGIRIGLAISVMVGIGIAIADFVYTKFIDPSFFENYEKMLVDQGRQDEIIEMTSTSAALFMLILVTVIGLIISLISALILQRKHK